MPNRALDFDYDLWANQQWLDVVPKMAHAARGMELLGHIAQAQWIWLNRCKESLGDATPSPANPIEINDDVFESLTDAWKHLLSQHEGSRLIEYQNLSGKSFQNSLDEIAAHVLNHGTYHRGQLRGLAEAENFEDFRDTDFIAYARA
ncbi:DinB family protein [Kamptonema cortianum]|nr:DinB family protein [Geitlerinema splendidum]MDK3156257.1 DinB family protein [Kamptonema cortianum]